MSEWSGWAKCSRRCGGGEQYRTRRVLEFAKADGAACGVTAESQLCNVGACTASCEFGPWSTWGSCSKRCKFDEDSQTGSMTRKRPIVTESKPGACKEEDTRELKNCNEQQCPSEASKMRCTSPQDILVVLDGSESAHSDDGSAFNHAKGLVKSLVQHSNFSAKKEKSLLRYAFVLFGAAKPQVLSPMTSDQAALLSALDGASFAGGSDNARPPVMVAQALATAMQVSRLATAGEEQLRHETVVLVTGSSLRSNVATETMAKRLRAVGTRVIVVQVGNIKNPVVQGDESECDIASEPCADNWIRVESWDKLSDSTQLGRYLSTICPLGS